MESICIIQPKVESPIFTIAIPTYKRADLLKEAIESALNQSFVGAYDVIVVDNNPERDDNTELAMKTYRANARIGYYKNSVNVGMTGNWNKLYELARGKHVVMLHDDDLLYNTSIEILDKFLKSTKYRYECVYSMKTDIRKRNEIPIVQRKITFSIKGLLNFFSEAEIPTTVPHKICYRERKFQDFSTGAILGVPSGMLLRRNVFERIGKFSDEFYPIMDQEFAFRATKHTNCCELKLPLIKYYVGANESLNPQTVKKGILSFNRLYRFHIKNNICGLWKVIGSLCFRFNLKVMCTYSQKFIKDPSIYETALENIMYKKHLFLDTLSMVCWFIAKAYLIIFRTRTISLG